MRNRIFIYSVVSLLFLLFNAMYCEDDLEDVEKLVNIEVDNIDNSGNEMIPARETIKKEAFVLGVKLFSSTKGLNDKWYEPQFSEGKLGFINTKSEVKIFANSHFNDNYPQESDITHLFIKYAPNINEEISNTDIFREYSYFLILREAPSVGVHSFKLVYELTDKSEDCIEFITEPILLN